MTTTNKRRSRRRRSQDADRPQGANSEHADEPQRSVPDAGRPAFAAAYPRDAELDRLVAAFERGNFRLVRGSVEALADSTEDDSVRTAALDLRRRLNPDPTAVYLLMLGTALVLILYAYYALYGQ